jgi:hypothetical protein
VKKGYHKVEWRYIKDGTGSGGADRAFIKSIEVFGTKTYESQCTACPVGYYSLPGQSRCIPCKADTFANTVGTAQCTPCPQGFYSKPGAKECLPRPLCTENDYYSYFTPCVNKKRTIAFEWKAPHICEKGVEKPQSIENQPCAPCPPGSARDPVTFECLGCPNGYFRASSEEECKPCEAGTTAIRTKYFNRFVDSNELPAGMSTSCLSYCQTAWHVKSNPMKNVGYLEVGGFGSGEGSVLEFEVDVR